MENPELRDDVILLACGTRVGEFGKLLDTLVSRAGSDAFVAEAFGLIEHLRLQADAIEETMVRPAERILAKYRTSDGIKAWAGAMRGTVVELRRDAAGFEAQLRARGLQPPPP